MKKKTKKLIENIRKSIKKAYPFLEESEQKEIFENFVYRSLLNEIIDLTKRSPSAQYFTDPYRINLQKGPNIPKRPPSIFSNDPMEVATAIGLKANMDPRNVLLALQNPKAVDPAVLSTIRKAISAQ